MRLGALGKREADAGPTTLDERERRIVRGQVFRLWMRVLLIVVVGSVAAWLL